MNVKEYKSAEHWQRIRKVGDDSIWVSTKDLAIFILGFAGLFITLLLGCI